MTPDLDPRLLLLADDDNCVITCCNLPEGAELRIDGQPVTLTRAVPLAHKLARADMAAGTSIRKLRMDIGKLGAAVQRGELIHTHNLNSAYTPTYTLEEGHTYVQH